MLAYSELLLPCLVVLLSKADSITINVTPIPKVCEEGPLPSEFSITCTVDDNTAVLSWVITGTTTPLGGPIARSYDSPPFKYPQPTSPGEATLNVQDPNNSEVVIGTCFQCRATVGIKRTDSEKQCLSAVVCSSSVVNGEPCMGEACASTVTVLSTPVRSVPASGIPPSPVLSPPVTPAPAPEISSITGGGISIEVVVFIILASIILIVLIFFYGKKKQGKLRSSSSTERLIYTDPEEMWDKKEQNKEEELVYVTDKFSESLSAEARKRKKMEAEEYAEVSFADARKPKKLE